MDEDLKTRPEQPAGAWKLLESPSELLIALRDQGGGVYSEVRELRPDRAVLAGDLAEMQPSDLLNFLHHGRRTGVLLARVSGIERGIVVLEGNVAWACSTSPAERLGEMLVRGGLADRARVEAVLAEQGDASSHRRLGELLVQRGVITADLLSRALRDQVVEIFLGLLVALSGSFVFLRGVDRAALPSLLGLDTQGMLLDGLRRIDEMELYRSLVPNAEALPKLTGKPGGEELGREAAQLLSLVDGTRTIADLALATALGEFEATKAAYRLIERGHLRL